MMITGSQSRRNFVFFVFRCFFSKHFCGRRNAIETIGKKSLTSCRNAAHMGEFDCNGARVKRLGNYHQLIIFEEISSNRARLSKALWNFNESNRHSLTVAVWSKRYANHNRREKCIEENCSPSTLNRNANLSNDLAKTSFVLLGAWTIKCAIFNF